MSQGLDLTKPVAGSSVNSAEIRANFQAIASQNKGSSEPNPKYEGMFWLYEQSATVWILRQLMDGIWRDMLIYDLSSDKISITSGVLMSKQDFKSGVQPVETPDGVISTFTLPSGEAYLPGTLSVFLNGQQYNPSNILQVAPAYKTFQIVSGDTLPGPLDSFVISYVLS